MKKMRIKVILTALVIAVITTTTAGTLNSISTNGNIQTITPLSEPPIW